MLFKALIYFADGQSLDQYGKENGYIGDIYENIIYLGGKILFGPHGKCQ